MQQPIIAIYVLWALWFLSWIGAALLTHGTKRLTPLQDVIYRTLIIVASVTLVFGFLPDPGFDVRNKLWMPLEGTAGWLLVAVVFVAFCFAWWARLQLGFALPGSTRKHEPFIEKGPYKWVRHPIYGCLTIAAIATALLFGRPSSFGGAALLAIAFLFKILIEESSLRSEFGSFDDYTDRVPMLVPGLKLRPERATTHLPPMPPRAVAETPALDPGAPVPVMAEASIAEPESPALVAAETSLVEPVAAPPAAAEPEPAIGVPPPAAAEPAIGVPLPAAPEPEIVAPAPVRESVKIAPAADVQPELPGLSEAISITNR